MMRLIAVAAALIVGLSAGLAPAQTSTVTITTAADPSTGAFDRLSAGNQRIARALHDAQVPGAAGSAPTRARKSLDQIAAMKQGMGWAQAFRQLSEQGLIEERTLGEVISRSSHAGRRTAGTQITTALGRTYDFGHVVGRPGSATARSQAAARGSSAEPVPSRAASGGEHRVAHIGNAGQ